MSSIPTNVANRGNKGSPSPRKPSTEKAGAKIQPQTELQSHLEKTAKFIKAFDILVRVFAWLACMLAAWLLACLVDHWLLPIPALLRWAIWFTLVGFTGWIVIRQIAPLLVGRINLDYAARRIEHSEPRFKEGLIAWLQLSNMPDAGVPRGVMAALTYRAYRFIGGQDPSSTVDSSPLIRGLAGFLVLACVMALYSFVSPKSSLATGLRIAMPWRSTAPPTRVHLSDIEPGSATVSAGKPLKVSVRATGVRNDEPVRLVFSTQDGQIVKGVVDLTEPDVGYIHTGELRTTPTGVEHKLQYWIEAGDAVSDKYSIDLAPTPSVVLERVELVYPAYTGLAKQISDGRATEAVEGTLATIIARSNQELKRGQLEINPTNSASGQLEKADRLIQMQIDGRKLTQDWPLLLGPDGISPEEIQYSVRGFNARGDANLNPILHTVSVVADVAPEIRLIGPKSRVLRVRPKTRMQLEIRASDPDYGLNEIELSVHKEGSAVASRKILVGDGLKGQQVKRQPLDIGRLSMQPGQRLELHATARDNRHDPRTGKWSPNETHADPLVIEVVGPQEPADVTENPQSGSDAADESQGDGTEQSGSSGQASEQSGPNGQTGENPSGELNPQDLQTENSQTSEQNKDSNSAPQNPGNESNSGTPEGNQQENSDPGGAQEQSGGQQSENEQAGSKQTGSPGGQSTTGSAAESSDPSGGSGQSDNQPEGGESSGRQPASGGNKSDNGSQDGSSKPNGGGNSDQENGENQSPNSASPSSANRRSGNNARAGAGGSPASDAGAMKQVEDFMRENPSENQGAQQGKKSQQQPSKTSNSSKSPTGDSQSSDKGDPSKGSNATDDSSQQTNDGQSTPPDSQAGQEQSAGKGQNTKNPQDENSGETRLENTQNPQQGSTPDNSGKQSNSDESQTQGEKAGNQQSGQQEGAGKAGEGKAGEGKSGEGKSGEGKSGEGKSGEGKSGEGKSGEGKSGEGKSGEGKSGEGKSGEGKSGEGKPGEGQQGKGESGAAGKPGDNSQSASEQAAEKQAAGEQKTEDKANGKQGKRDGAPKQGGEKPSGGQTENKPNKTTGEKGSESETQKQDGRTGEKPSEAGKQSASGEKSKPQSPTGGPPGSSKPGNNTGQVGNPTGSAGSNNRDGGGPDSSVAADREAAERAADLVLDYLDRQREQPNPDLLREVNWDKNDLNNFVDRWKHARQLASQGDDDARQKWKELLTELQLGSGRSGSLGPMKRSDDFQQMSDSATRMEPPKALLKRWEAVQRALKDR